MALVSIRLPDDLERIERERFLGEIARAARERGHTEALAVAAEALLTDNEALTASEHTVQEPKTPTIVVLPLTTQVRASKEPLHVTIPKRDGLSQACQIMPEQPRTLDRKRLIEGPLTRLTPDEMAKVERSFRAVTGLYD